MRSNRFWSIVFVVMGAMLFTACGGKKSDGPPQPIVCEFGKSGDPERCDGKDNDCDEDTDEYADVLCGTDCVAAPKLNCSSNEFPPFGESWPEPDSSNSSGSIILDDDGNITLGQTQQTFLHVWIANSVEGTVSKLDAETGKELARYPSIIANGTETAVGIMDHDAKPHDEPCGQPPFRNDTTLGNCPSRTAVDQDGQAYVANRAFSGQGTVTKFADFGTDAQKLENCDDRNNDGVIQTSSDVNGDGAIDPENGQEFIGPEDECILWTVNVGGNHGVPRALAVGLNRDGAPGLVWVGLHSGERPATELGERGIVALDPKTGAVEKEFSAAELEDNGKSCQPYGAVTVRDGRIWWVCRDGAEGPNSTRGLGYVTPDGADFVFAAEQPDDSDNTYGIGADYNGNVYMTSNSSTNGIVWRYQPSTGTWTKAGGDDPGSPKGVAVDREHLWVALSKDGGGQAQTVLQYKLDDLSFVESHPIGCSEPVGVGISANGYIWAVCYGPANQPGHASFFDGVNWVTQPVGLNPYTYSDFTGFGLNSIAEDGKYRFTAQGCTGPSERTQWEGLVIDQGTITPETPVSVRVRSASSEAALKDESFTDPIPVAEIGQVIPFAEPKPGGLVLQIEILLSTNNPDVVPKIKSLQFVRNCYIDVP